MDLDAYVLAHAHEWQRLEQLVHRGRLQGAESDELVDLYAQVATHLSVVRTSAPDPSLVAHLSSLLAKARNKAVGTRVSSWRGFASFFTERFPAALYRLRWWWLGCLAANVVVTAVMMLLAARPPERRAEPALARRDRPAGQPRLRGLLLDVRRQPLRAAGVDQQRLGLGAVHRLRDPRAAGDLPALQQHREPGGHRLDHAPAPPRPGVLGADPPARPARAHRGLRGRRRRAAAVLVVDRAGRAHPNPVHRPRGADGGHGQRWGWPACSW